MDAESAGVIGAVAMSALALTKTAIELVKERSAKASSSSKHPPAQQNGRTNGVLQIQCEAEMGRVEGSIKELKSELAETRRDVVGELKEQAKLIHKIEIVVARIEAQHEKENR